MHGPFTDKHTYILGNKDGFSIKIVFIHKGRDKLTEVYNDKQK